MLLEAGALLHDIGHTVSHHGHHKHGEYLALNGDIPGLDWPRPRRRRPPWSATTIANRNPPAITSAYSSLSNLDKRITRRLASILRIAEGLDHSHRQRVTNIHASFQRGAVGLQIKARGDAAEDLRDASRSADLFEKEFHVRLYFRQIES